MDVAQALADLTEISSQIDAAVLFAPDGSVTGSTLADEDRALQLVGTAQELLAAAEEARAGSGALTQLEAATLEGSVFVVRDGDRLIVATTAPEPTVGLVFYDLKSCLKAVGDAAAEQPKPKPKRKPAARKPRKQAAENGKADA